jgi:hypothetical protein
MEEFKPRSWGADPIDLEKEYNAWEDAQTAQESPPDKPEGLSTSLVRRGLIDPNTGLRTGNKKQEFISSWTPSETFQQNYQAVFGHA